ncbi:MAG: hypothetical protein RI947_1133 [Candidatus Parcubacteria bacterium]
MYLVCIKNKNYTIRLIRNAETFVSLTTPSPPSESGGFFLGILFIPYTPMSAESATVIQTGSIHHHDMPVHPYYDWDGREATFACKPLDKDGNPSNKRIWAERAGLEIINGGLESATSKAEDYMDHLLGINGVEAYDLYGLGVPYHLHAAAMKARGGLHWYQMNKPDGYGGKPFATADVTLRMKSGDYDIVLNKPENNRSYEEIARAFNWAIQTGAEISYDAGVAVGILGVDDMRLCTVHSRMGTMRQDVGMESILEELRMNREVTGGMDGLRLILRDFVHLDDHVETTVTEYDQLKFSPAGLILPYMNDVQTDPNQPDILLVTNAVETRKSLHRVAPDAAVNGITLGCLARGLVPVL